jgi:hypothetical protein
LFFRLVVIADLIRNPENIIKELDASQEEGILPGLYILDASSLVGWVIIVMIKGWPLESSICHSAL